jgi:outer membrane immunogenic protein
MRAFLATSVSAGAILIGAVGAQAADIVRPIAPSFVAPVAPVPAFSWSGCYVGVHTGWARGTSRSQGITTTSGGTTDFLTNDIDVSGGLFGGQIGCDFQTGPSLVIGFRGSLAGADINGVGQDLYCSTDNSCSGDDTVKIDSLATLTGRIGFTGIAPSHLLYIQGGIAWAHNIMTWHPSSYDYGYQASQSRFGWTVGFGLERMLLPNTSFFVEANWFDFGTKNTGALNGSTYSADVTQRFGTVLAGLNFRFGH